MRTLTLTTPQTRGPAVDRAQRILTNRGYFVGKIDGVFGEITGRACSDAKYALGYATKNIKPSYGNDLEAFLTGKKKPTPAMRIRANQRKKKTSLGEMAVRIAQQYVGVKENPPGSNKVMFSEWYGIVGAWCAMFVTFCFVEAGSKAFKRGDRWAYCPFLLADARNPNISGVTIVPEGEEMTGDIALYGFGGTVAKHVGIVVTPPRNGISFIAIEGNTSVGADSDGGEVMVRQRHTKDVIAFVRAVR
jgi:hypothetical protein